LLHIFNITQDFLLLIFFYRNTFLHLLNLVLLTFLQAYLKYALLKYFLLKNVL